MEGGEYQPVKGIKSKIVSNLLKVEPYQDTTAIWTHYNNSKIWDYYKPFTPFLPMKPIAFRRLTLAITIVFSAAILLMILL